MRFSCLLYFALLRHEAPEYERTPYPVTAAYAGVCQQQKVNPQEQKPSVFSHARLTHVNHAQYQYQVVQYPKWEKRSFGLCRRIST